MSFELKKAQFIFKFFSGSRLAFYEDFSAALADGASDNEHLKKLAMRARLRGGSRAVLYESWLRKMKRVSFAHALQGSIPSHEVMVLTAGEEDARLSDAMGFLSRAIKTENSIKAAYIMSLISPLLGAVMVSGFLMAYALWIAPVYIQAVPLEQWPLMSFILYKVSNGLVNNGGIFILLTGLVFAVINWSKSNWKGGVRARFDKLYGLPWKSYRNNQSISFLVTLAILMQSNSLGMKEALLRIRKLANPWLYWNVSRMLKRLEITPDTPAKCLDVGFFDVALLDRIEDYSERSGFFSALFKLAFEQSDRFVKVAERKAITTGFIGLLLVASVLIFVVFANYEMNAAIESVVSKVR